MVLGNGRGTLAELAPAGLNAPLLQDLAEAGRPICWINPPAGDERRLVIAAALVARPQHLGELVVKEVHGSGGYGMLVGPASTRTERERFAELIKADPRNYIAQPTLAISTVPTLSRGMLEPRHVDLRPFILTGETVLFDAVPNGARLESASFMVETTTVSDRLRSPNCRS